MRDQSSLYNQVYDRNRRRIPEDPIKQIPIEYTQRRSGLRNRVNIPNASSTGVANANPRAELGKPNIVDPRREELMNAQLRELRDRYPVDNKIDQVRLERDNYYANNPTPELETLLGTIYRNLFGRKLQRSNPTIDVMEAVAKATS